MTTRADDLLRTYRAKRNFGTTEEPSGTEIESRGSAKQGLAFCVQKHDATRLHYDFRVEWEGVLKSWAVTRGPSLDPADKRLAVRTEDHPLDYGDFEGTIPAGEYGGGTVMLWDHGTWEPEPGTDPAEGLAGGNLKMVLRGEKMAGRWALIRMKPRGKETRENWLLIKEKDETADPAADLLSMDRSVASGRDMAAIAAGGKAWSRPTKAPSRAKAPDHTTKSPLDKKVGPETTSRRQKSKTSKGEKDVSAAQRRSGETTRVLPRPSFRKPQLATLVDKPPEGEEWLHEMKYDGYRVLIALGHGGARLYTRTGLDWTDRFGAVLPAVEALPCKSALIDGEIIAFDETGRTDFSTLQAHLKDGGDLACFCFDLMELDGEDLAKEPLTKRKSLLKALLDSGPSETLHFSEHVVGQGAAVFDGIRQAGHEGIVSKRAAAPYRAGRGTTWLKTKCTRRQEFVIGGISTSDKRGRAFSSLLVGIWEEDRLVYRGRVGSGFDERSLDELSGRLAKLERKTSPFAELPPAIRPGARFVAPTLVAEIDFAEITADGQIRHGVFKGLREDKPAGEVTGEMPKPSKTATGSKKPTSIPGKQSARTAARADAPVAGIALTHSDREVFPGITKWDIAAYYEAVAGRMLVHAGHHALSLVRCPRGPKSQCFFQKHDSGGFPDAIRKVAIAEKDGGTADYLFVQDAAGLVAAVQMNALEFHVWGAPTRKIETPDRLVFDLDPDEGLSFPTVREAAFDLRRLLEHLGLESFALVTGGKGVHVVVPLTGRQGWDVAKTFAHDFATKLADGDPARFVATMSKAKRKGRIFIDWLRNERGATAISPYSTRAREGAPVATPVSWDELKDLDRADGFDIETVLARLEEPDPWADYRTVRQSLTKAIVSKLYDL